MPGLALACLRCELFQWSLARLSLVPANAVPNNSWHGAGVSASQRRFPGGGLDVALLLWRQGEFNSMEVGFSMPVGLGATAQSWTHLAY